MFNWLTVKPKRERDKKVALPPEIFRPFYLKKIDDNKTPREMSELAAFFAAASVLIDEGTMVSLPVRNEAASRMVLAEIAPHFNDVKIVYVDDEADVVNMRLIKPESAALFHNGRSGISGIMRDFFRTGDISLWTSERRRKIGSFTVDNSKLAPYDVPDTQSLKQYITSAYFNAEEDLSLTPTGWTFEDGLRDSIALRFFAAFVPQITLVVDLDEGRVIGVDLSKE
ncbi:hypothetical protein [Paenibacillus hamazuiensis]|uniref:hypothetical protein n=1 Tax=Paenibacillus hamazuiensis TaxID=2936508 RepID=UPI00200C9A15|nr:hypothetical protein [Paenibacillus hamazuiensis]